VRSARPRALAPTRASAALLIALAPATVLAQDAAPPVAVPQVPVPPGMQPFVSRSATFRLALPASWRQVGPGEVDALRRAVPQLPRDVGQEQPGMFYAVGAVDRWRAGAFDGAYLYVVEQDNEWQLDDQLAERLQRMWHDKGAREGVRYEISDVAQAEVGAQRHPAVTCLRTMAPPGGRPQRSLDVHVPTGGRELILCFVAWADEFDANLPRFRAMLATLELARRARGEATLGDRLWTPLITAAVVGILLAALYRHTRRRVV